MKIALCLSGNSRSFVTCYDSIYKSIIKDRDVDVFISTWGIKNNFDYNFKFCEDESDINELIQLYNPKLTDIQDYDKEQESIIINDCNGNELLKYDELNTKTESLINYAFNAMSMYYKIYRCNNLKIQYEKTNNFKYDIVIRSRMDFLFENRITDEMLQLASNDNDIILIKDEYAKKSKCLCNDKFCFGTSNLMDRYCDLFNNINKYHKEQIIIDGQVLCAHHIVKLGLNIKWIDINYSKIRPRKKICDICGERFKCNKIINNHTKIKHNINTYHILVTGCAGFIGSHLTEYLLKNNYFVIGIDNINNYYSIDQKNDNLDILKKYDKFTFIKEDILDTKCILEYDPDIVIHLAGMAGVRYSLDNPELYINNNINGYLNILKQCKELFIPIIFASSSSVYGLNEIIPFKESDNCNKLNSIYSITKQTMEQISEMYTRHYDMNITGLRFFTVYGPRGRPDMFPFKCLYNIINNKTIYKYGKKSIRDYTYIDDVVSGIYKCMNYMLYNDDTRYNVFNLGSNNPISLDSFIKTCELICNKKADIIVIEHQKGDVPQTHADITLAHDIFDYNPEIDLNTGLQLTYNWLIN